MLVAECGGGTSATRERRRRTDDLGARQRCSRRRRWGASVSGSHRPAGPDQRADVAGSGHQRPDRRHLCGKNDLHQYRGSKAFRPRGGSLRPGAQCPAGLWRGGAAPTTSPDATASIVAATVEISPAVNLLGPGRSANVRSSPVGGSRGTDRAHWNGGSDRARGSGGGGNGFGRLGAFGKVTAVNAAGFTIESSRPQNSTTTSPVPTTQTVRTPAGGRREGRPAGRVSSALRLSCPTRPPSPARKTR